ncbi:MAG: hypothetical protein C4308_08500 [Chitinophagaceae bacterium]
MRKLFFFLPCLLFLQISFAQVTVRVCNYVDNSDNTYSAKNIFTINDSDELLMLVNSDKEFNTYRLDYKIYRVNSYGETTYDVTISQDGVQAN